MEKENLTRILLYRKEDADKVKKFLQDNDIRYFATSDVVGEACFSKEDIVHSLKELDYKTSDDNVSLVAGELTNLEGTMVEAGWDDIGYAIDYLAGYGKLSKEVE